MGYKKESGMKSFFAYLVIIYFIMLVIALLLFFVYDIPPVGIAEILYSAVFGVCVGFGISYITGKKD